MFHDAQKLEAAAEELVKAGFPQSRLSLLGDQVSVAKRLGHHFEPVEVMEDDPRAHRAPSSSRPVGQLPKPLQSGSLST